MIPIVDARTGKIIRIGEFVRGGPEQDAGFVIECLHTGVLRAKAVTRTRLGLGVVECPIRYFPRLTYGPEFPADGLRAAIFPS